MDRRRGAGADRDTAASTVAPSDYTGLYMPFSRVLRDFVCRGFALPVFRPRSISAPIVPHPLTESACLIFQLLLCAWIAVVASPVLADLGDGLPDTGAAPDTTRVYASDHNYLLS